MQGFSSGVNPMSMTPATNAMRTGMLCDRLVVFDLYSTLWGGASSYSLWILVGC